jgi:two-component system, sensor histidine kinase
MIAEDNECLGKVYSKIISRMVKGVSLDYASSGEELVEKARKCRYDLIITDNEFNSKINGLEATKMIRTFDKSTPIYMVSGCSVEGLALKAGANGYIQKGSDSIPRFTEMIAKHVKD